MTTPSSKYVGVVAEGMLDTTDPNATDLQTGGQRLNAHFHNYEAVELTNQTAAGAVDGDVVAISDSNDAAVELDDVQGSTRTFVVAQATIANTTLGEYAARGYVANVKSTGTIAQARWVRKSATTKAVEDAGAGIATTPPAGSIGFSLAAAAANRVSLYLFGHTVVRTDSTLRAGFRGLKVYSDPSSPNNMVRILCEEATLVDSSGATKRFPSVDVLVDLAVAGENGRDAGTEDASTEYDLYLAGKADGTVCGHFSKGFQWLVDALSYADSNRDAVRALRDTSARTYVAQGFTLTQNCKLHSIDISLLRILNPSGVMWAEIWSDSGGNPSALITGGRSLAIPVNDVDTANRVRMRFIFPQRPALTSPTQYHVVFRGSWTIDGTNFVNIGVDASAPGYPGVGQIKTGDATPTWSNQTEDAALFFVNVLTGTESLVFAAGYSYKGRCSWNRNDGSSNLLQVRQRDEKWEHAAKVTADVVSTLIWSAQDISASMAGAWAKTLHVTIQNTTAGQFSKISDPLPLGSPNDTLGAAWRVTHDAGNPILEARIDGQVGPMIWVANNGGATRYYLKGFELLL